MKTQFLLLALFAVPTTALAAEKMAIVQQPNSPVRIDYCGANLSDNGATLYAGDDFTVTDSQPATAVRFSFTPVDAFEGHGVPMFGDDTGAFQPGVLVRHSKPLSFTFTKLSEYDHLECAVELVKLADGTIWRRAK